MVAASTSVQRVVTTFILTNAATTTPPNTCNTHQNQQEPSPPNIAIFHRSDAMPTFASHWAGISGTIEDTENPHQAAQRELSEETNVTEKVEEQGGLYLDVSYVSSSSQKEKTIRVYPFVVHVPPEVSFSLELRGTEHDRYQWMSVDQLEEMESECVPGLVRAFHHATYGAYDKSISPAVRKWANDVENGASVMAAKSLCLLSTPNEDNEDGDDDDEGWKATARQIAMLRPSMVPICNVMQHVIDNGKDSVTSQSFQEAIQESAKLGIQRVSKLMDETKQPLTIATFSRSGTLRQILTPLLDETTILCGRSSPGDEGELMAKDLAGASCISDDELETKLSNGSIDLLLFGADCVLPKAKQVVNKVGTQTLCRLAQDHQVPVFCCADRWKVWGDKYPPPIEKDLFELVSMDLINELLVPMED